MRFARWTWMFCALLAACAGPTADVPLAVEPTAPAAAAVPSPARWSPPVVPAAEVESLIARLAEIDRPDFGLAETLSGSCFPPVPGSEHVGTWLFTNHRLSRSDALLRLVQAGPVALPALLAHLGDRVDTRLVVRHGGGGGTMWLDEEISINAASDLERRAAEPAKLESQRMKRRGHRPAHTVAVGDVCYVVLGMITNRRFEAVRYQPSNCIVVNSTVHRPTLAACVRAMWPAATPDALRQRLLDDLAAPDPPQESPRTYSAVWPMRGRALRSGAAMRLLYYFPEDAVPHIVARLSVLEARMARPDAHDAGSDAKSPVDDELVGATAWCPDDRIRDAVRRVARVTRDASVAVMCTPAMIGVPGDAHRQHLLVLAGDAGADRAYPTGTPQDLLDALATLYPERLDETCAEYLAYGGKSAAANVIDFVDRAHADRAPVILAPLLDDRRLGWAAESSPRLCDLAYAVIARALDPKSQPASGTPAQMDERIAALKRRLEAR